MDSLSGLVRAMEQARALTAVVCSPEDEVAAERELFRWAARNNLTASMFRSVGEDGKLTWWVEVDAGRGRLGGAVDNPALWYLPMQEVGLWPTPTTSI